MIVTRKPIRAEAHRWYPGMELPGVSPMEMVGPPSIAGVLFLGNGRFISFWPGDYVIYPEAGEPSVCPASRFEDEWEPV